MTRTEKQQFSEQGTTTITSASGEISGLFVAIQCIEETTFTTLTQKNSIAPSARGGSGADLADAQTYPAGFTMYGLFTDIEVATGVVRVTEASED